MVTVLGNKVVFSRDQVVTSTQAVRSFARVRSMAQTSPVFVSDKTDGIDTVVIGFDEFERMAVALNRLNEEKLYGEAAARIEAASESQRGISLEEVLGEEGFRAFEAADPDSISDEELFE